jgi:ADP-heptose:LPS heptosyltransferase
LNRFFIIQISAGNNKTPYKNWPISKWQVLIKKLCTTFKRLEFIIVGDNTEVQYIKQFEDLNCENCSILIGKTTIKELFNLIGHCQGYIGLDSGLMHIAVALKKKTFTIFGASNEKNYGYEFIDPEHHQVITSNVICRPCSSWKNANTSRITNPLHCPDYACLSSIDANQVFNQVCYHFNLSSIFEK